MFPTFLFHMEASKNVVGVRGTKTNLKLANELLNDIESRISCNYSVVIDDVKSFHYALRTLNYQLMNKEDDGKPIILALTEDDDGVEIHNLYYGYSLLVASKYKPLVKKLSYPI